LALAGAAVNPTSGRVARSALQSAADRCYDKRMDERRPTDRHTAPLRGGMQAWPLRISTILDHAARFHGDREVVTRSVEGPIHRTNYRQIAVRARRCAAALDRAGIGLGDRVGTLAWNSWRHLEVWYGAAGAGGIYHTVNPRLFDDQIGYIIEDADDRLIFADLTFLPLLERLRDRLVGRRLVMLTDAAHMPTGSPLDLECYEDLIAGEDEGFAWREVDEETPVGLCYTSGTTGAPKGVVYSHRSNVLQALMVHGADGLALRAASSVLAIVPMYHANAWSLAFSAPMTGAKLVLPGRQLDGASLCELLVGEEVTFTGGVPTVLIEVLKHTREAGVRLPKLERVVTGGSACPGWIIEAFAQELGVEVVHAWGMTEMSPLGSFASPRAGMAELAPEARAKLKLKQGAPFYGVELRVLDEAGQAAALDGETSGRLQARGPAVVAEYLHGAGGEILDADGFFDTGDQATLDGFGYIQITDRTKDMIKSGGEWISSIDLENEASCHPEVEEAAAIGVVHDRWCERPLLLAVRTAGSTLTEAELLEFLAPRVVRWWLPDAVRFIEQMPHTATGKINKMALRLQFADFRFPGAGK
jgi:fatty-acyl-CoA synthase